MSEQYDEEMIERALVRKLTKPMRKELHQLLEEWAVGIRSNERRKRMEELRKRIKEFEKAEGESDE